MTIGTITHGFELRAITELPEKGSVFYEYRHVKSGAKLGYIKNGDTNKSFSISFKTLPSDDTGVFHILEHCCLQGSEKYPVKGIINELMKSSMKTFLNAMTYPDRTIFPLSSRNEQDFHNLVNVYMDAVLHPLLHEDENIFLQEGWHYEINEDGEAYCNGVVLNEMKGASSNVYGQIYNELQAALYPDTCYRYNAGGAPEAIPTLTLEQFRSQHRRFYRPENAIILLDGEMDLEAVLRLLDEEHLGAYTAGEMEPFTIPIQAATGHIRKEALYAVSEIEQNQGQLGLAYSISAYDEPLKAQAVKILADYLMGSNEAPVKKAILESGLACDLECYFADSLQQHFLGINVKNIDPDKKDEIISTIHAAIAGVIEDGPDKEQLEALLTQLDFSYHEQDYGSYPAGLVNMSTVLGSWLYGGEPTLLMSMNRHFKALHQMIADGTIAGLMEEFFLKNNHTADVLMRPLATFLKDSRDQEAVRVAKIWSSLNEAQRAEIADRTQRLKLYQAAPNTQEQLMALPHIALSDISKEPMKAAVHVLSDGTRWHRAGGRGIRYIRSYSRLRNLSDREYAMLPILCRLMGTLPLKSMDKTTLETKMHSTFGGFGLSLKLAGDPYLMMEFSYLEEKEEEAMELAGRILCETELQNAGRVGDLLHQQSQWCKEALVNSGHTMAITRAEAAVSESGRINDLTDGPTFCEWVENAVKAFDRNPSSFLAELNALAGKVFSVRNRMISVTGEGDGEEYVERVSALFPQNEFRFEKADSDSKYTPKMHTSVAIPAAVSYSGAAVNLAAAGLKYTGAWSVFSRIASMDHLWNRIRVQGGAYGAGMAVKPDGLINFYSYRDPDPDNSLKCWLDTADFMEDFAAQENDLSSIIIGAVAGTEPIMSQSALDRMDDEWFLMGRTDDTRRKNRKEILETTNETLKQLAAYLKAMPSATCIVKE